VARAALGEGVLGAAALGAIILAIAIWVGLVGIAGLA
jgi:hypothetical protein